MGFKAQRRAPIRGDAGPANPVPGIPLLHSLPSCPGLQMVPEETPVLPAVVCPASTSAYKFSRLPRGVLGSDCAPTAGAATAATNSQGRRRRRGAVTVFVLFRSSVSIFLGPQAEGWGCRSPGAFRNRVTSRSASIWRAQQAKSLADLSSLDSLLATHS